MIITEFLSPDAYHQYGDWLRSQDSETRQLYFGVADGMGLIDSVMNRIESEPHSHKFLVARKQDQWAGVIHLAEVSDKEIEFGITVAEHMRGQGIANLLMDQALTWSRNRGYRELFMHCLTRNQAIKHLCNKHGLTSRSMFGDTAEVQMPLAPLNAITLAQEICTTQRNLFHAVLQNNQNIFKEIYG